MPTRERRTRRRRLPAGEARQVLLEAGRDYVYEHPLGEPLDHVRVTDIVERAGVSIGAVYHYWETQDDYRDELIEVLLSPDEFPNIQQAAEVVAEAWDDAPTFEDLARIVAGISYHGLEVNPQRERLYLAFVAYGDAGIDERLGHQANVISLRWAELFATYFPAYGLEPRPPFTYESMAVTLMAMVEGMNLRRTISPDIVTGDVAPGWDLFATSALTFVVGATRPIDAEDDPSEGERDVWALARHLIPTPTPST
jgi:AcrR family transcriptional regulator